MSSSVEVIQLEITKGKPAKQTCYNGKGISFFPDS